jgi:ParB-like chromosome segregation protein Spo0J
MSRTSSQKLVRLDTLQPHPENATIYRDADRTPEENEELLNSLCTHGLWDGHVQVHAQSSMILNGHRRVLMALELGIEEAVITLRHDLPEDPTDPEVLQFLLNGNTQREKTNTERLREFEVRKEVEKVLAKRRQEAGLRQNHRSGAHHRDGGLGDSRDIAARKAGVGNGSTAEKALKVLKEADQLEESAPEKAQAIKAALNKSLSTGITVAKAVTATAPAKPKVEPVAATTMKFVATPTAAKPPMEVEGKRLRNIHRCKKLDGYQQNRTYLEREMPKAIDKIKAAERQLRKIGDHLRDQFVHDRAFPEFMTVWAEAWKEEDPSYDFIAEMEKLSGTVSLLQGALTGFQRFAHTTEVMIDRSEP